MIVTCYNNAQTALRTRELLAGGFLFTLVGSSMEGHAESAIPSAHAKLRYGVARRPLCCHSEFRAYDPQGCWVSGNDTVNDPELDV